MPEPLETYHTSPHLYTDLDIPAGTTGRLPRAKRTLAGLDAEVLEDLGGPRPRSEGRGRGRGLDKGGRGRAHSGERNRRSKDGDREPRAGQQGRSDRGTRGRGRGNHSQPAEGAPKTAKAPRQRVRRRKGGDKSAE